MPNRVRFVDPGIIVQSGGGSGGGTSISSSYALSASYADYAVSASHEIVKEVSASYADTASYAVTASYALNAGTGGEDSDWYNGGTFITSSVPIQVTGSVDVKSGHVNLGSNSYFFQGSNTSNSNVSLIGVNSSDQIYIGNQGYTNIIADDTNIEGDTIITGSLQVTEYISASGDLYVRDGRFSRDGGAAEIEIIASEAAGGIVGTQTSDNLLFRRFNIPKFTISESRNFSHQNLDVQGQVSASTFIGDGSQLENLPETDSKYLVYQTGSSSNNIQPISGSNLTTGNYSVIGGGLSNFVSESLYVTIGGGTENTATACGVTIGGGCNNKATCFFYASILGGLGNHACAGYSSVVGGSSNRINSSGGWSIIAGGNQNCITQYYSAIGGGSYNCITGDSDQSVVAGGRCNIIDGISSDYSIIGGGFNNNINASECSGIFGGEGNTISNHTSSFIIGSNITANASCTTFVNNLNVSSSIITSGDAQITGSLVVSSSVVDFTGATAISGSTFSGSFVGDGSQLTGIETDPFPYTGSAIISGSLGITGSLSIAEGTSEVGTSNFFAVSKSGANITQRIGSTATGLTFHSDTQNTLISSNQTASLSGYETTVGALLGTNVTRSINLGVNNTLPVFNNLWNIYLGGGQSDTKLFIGSSTTELSGSLSISGSLLNTGTVSIDDTDSPYTLTGTQQFVLIDPSGGNVTINMPDAATYPGRQIFFKLTQAAGANTVTLQRQGSDTIDGATTYTDLDVQYESISTVSNGSNGWFIF